MIRFARKPHSEEAPSLSMLYRCIRIMYILSVTTMVCILLGGISGILFVDFIIEYHRCVWVLLALFLGCFGVLACLYWRYDRHKTQLPVVQVPVSVESAAEIAANCCASEMSSRAYVGRQTFRGMGFRTVILYQNTYQPDQLKAAKKQVNNAFNRKRTVSSEGSMWTQNKKVRLNIVVLEHADQRLVQWVNKNPGMLLQRTEAILNIGVFLDQKTLLVPAVMENLTPNSVRKYHLAVEFLKEFIVGRP